MLGTSCTVQNEQRLKQVDCWFYSLGWCLLVVNVQTCIIDDYMPAGTELSCM